MTAPHKNHFPAALEMAIRHTFGEQWLQPVLLRLIAADTAIDTTSGLLHPREQTVLKTSTLAKRRSEYVTGRICAKKAVQAFLLDSRTFDEPLPLAEIEIGNMINGRPHVFLPYAGAQQLQLDLSISHSGDYAAAITARCPCGIDVQMRKKTLLKVQEKYCTEVEVHLLARLLANCEPLTRLTILWAAKEAGKKALSYWRMPGFLDLQVHTLTSHRDHCAVVLKVRNKLHDQIPAHITVVAAMFGDYALALCLLPKENG